MSECRFCNIQKSINTGNEFDKPIQENDRFMTVATIGAFIMGWCLVVPKKHTYNLRKFFGDDDFRNYVNDELKMLKKKYNKQIIAFEHGANRCDSETACGTAHAHLHLVPFERSLKEKMYSDRNWMEVSIDEIEDIVKENEYLLYTELEDRIENSIFYVHVVKNAESQYFRRLLGEERNVLNYSYKKYPRIEESITNYRSLIS